MTNLFIFNTDFRLKDNPALFHAAENGDSLVALFIHNPKKWQSHNESDLKIAFQIEHLKRLSKKLSELNISLKIIQAEEIDQENKKIIEFVENNNIKEVFLNKEYGIDEIKRDKNLEKELLNIDKKLNIFDSSVFNPDSIKTQSDTFFKVFTPFSRAFRSKLLTKKIELLGSPKKQEKKIFESDEVVDISLKAERKNILELYAVGEEHALNMLKEFIDHKILGYKEQRNFPAIDGTSSLSPYLSSGVLSSRQCLFEVFKKVSEEKEGVKTWVNEIIWREFYKYVLFHNPRVSKNLSFLEKYDLFPWSDNQEHFIAWSNGETGVPIIDAAMKQLNSTGWMHNRLRMIVAMYLSKNLLIDWRKGEKYFMQNLIDGDLASNNGGWQWSASTGVDAAPYFRIFNPVTQSEKFDKEGDFIKKWLPEISSVKNIHDPSSDDRNDIGYSIHLVDLKESRKNAIEVFSNFSK
jgi:deoxyribodipyrimidine photo-lyase